MTDFVEHKEEILQDLHTARGLIEKKENWLQGDYSDKGLAGIYDGTATRFCAVGGLYMAARNRQGKPDPSCSSVARRFAIPYNLIGVNDREGHEAVLKVYDEMIEKAEGLK